MMPLWTSASRSVACGWALVSVGLPWVAQRVWPMPERPGERRAVELVLEVAELALGAAAGELPVFEGGDAGRVVAAIFEALEGVEKQRRRRPRPQYPDDPAHASRADSFLRHGAIISAGP